MNPEPENKKEVNDTLTSSHTEKKSTLRAQPSATGPKTETEKIDHTALRDKEVIPVVMELLIALGAKAAKGEIPMGVSGIKEEDLAIFYQKVYEENLIPALIKHNIKLNDLHFLFTMALQPFQLLQDITISSFEVNRDLADARSYKIQDIDDLRVNDLDYALKHSKSVDSKIAQEHQSRIGSPQSVDKKVA